MPTQCRPEIFPDLPPHSKGDAWSSVVCEAHQILSTAYYDSAVLLRFEDGDPLRLHLHATRLLKRKVPILQALEQEVENPAWITSCAEAFGILAQELLDAAAKADAVLESNVVCSLPLYTVKSGRRGQPRIIIDRAWLEDATSSHRRIPLTTIAKALGVHRNTLCNKMRLNNIQRKFSTISDEDLEHLIRRFKLKKPNSGLRYVMGFLEGNGLRVQKTRVRGALQHLDGLRQALHNHAAIDRREYSVPYSNYLWHIDGYHKLICWGFVLHGGADGHDRAMLMLRANTNNYASTVLALFLSAVEQWGVPSRVRGDRGRENLEIAVWITKYRGAGRALFMWGSSTRNTRIECMWVEVGTQFAYRWHAFFTRLERHHQLDSSNPAHLWLLHLIFLDELNSDCDDFRTQWNHHPISGKGQDRSPLDIRFLGQLKQGIPHDHDDFLGVHPSVLEEHYGVDGGKRHRLPGQTGAGHSDTESDSSSECASPTSDPAEPPDLDAKIAASQDHHIRHDAIQTPPSVCPFTCPSLLAPFMDAKREVNANGIIPMCYGVAEAEWEDRGYGTYEFISLGQRGRRVAVELPFSVWWPRAVAWT